MELVVNTPDLDGKTLVIEHAGYIRTDGGDLPAPLVMIVAAAVGPVAPCELVKAVE